MAEEQIGLDGFFEHLTHLFLSDDSARWKGLLIILAVGAMTGVASFLSGETSSEDTMIRMSISMLITSICLFAFYSFIHKRTSSETPMWPRIPLGVAGALCSLALAFGFISYIYQKNSLNKEFSDALKANDYARVASVTEQAATVSDHLHETLLLKSEQNFIAATKQPAKWNAILVSLQQIPVTPPPINQLVFNPMKHALKVFPGAFISGGAFDVSAVSGDAIERGISEVNHSLPTLDGTVIKSGRQTLDGFEWKNVTFIGTHLFYNGGAVKLEGVIFVNCTFELPPDTKGAKLAQYIALTLPTLELET